MFVVPQWRSNKRHWIPAFAGMTTEMKLYGYFRSSAAYRVRIALGLKGLEYEYVAIHLRKGEQSTAQYRELNPGELVPTLVDDRGTFTQSLAIAREQSNVVHVIVAPDWNRVTNIAVGQRPRGMALSGDRKRLYVAVGNDDRIDVIDCVAQRYLRALPDHPGVAGVLIANDRELLFSSDRAC